MEIAAKQLFIRLTLLVMAVSVVFLTIGGSAEADVPDAPGVEYVVDVGDSLWSIARRVSGPEADIRDVIEEIKILSGIDVSTIFPGQVLLLPGG